MGYISKGSFERTKAAKTKFMTCVIFGVLFLTTAVLTMIVDPIAIIVRYYSRVDYNTVVHEALNRETDSVHLSAYLFNITNAEQFLSGEDEKLKIEEVGPFTYQENRTNEDLEIDTASGLLRYTPRYKVNFLPEESVGNPEDMIVTMPNMAMLAMASLVSEYGYIAKMGFNVLAAQLNSNATVTMSAYDYLWGYNEPLIRLGNQFLPGWISFDKLGLLDRLYDLNSTYRMEVTTREDEKFMIKKVNGIGGLKMWGYEDTNTRSRCNSFTDTYEGYAYPPDLQTDRPIRIYRSILCRLMELQYHGTTTTDFGISGLVYKISNRSFTSNEETDCLCSKGLCYEGVSDMSPCLYGLPVVLSNAHFTGASRALFDRIEGITPDEEKHGSGFTVEPKLGMVMATKFSVQVSVMVKDVSFNHKIKKFSDMFVPVTYVKIVQPKMAADQISTLRMVHIYCPYIMLALQSTLIIASLLLLGHAAKLLYWNWIYDKRNGTNFVLETTDKEVSSEPLMR